MSYNGTLTEVLTALWASRQGVAQRSELSRSVADATGVVPETASRWLRGKQPPKGVVRSRLLVHLVDECGATVAEFSRLDPRVQALNRLIAHDVVTLDELTDLLGYKNEQDTHRLLRGETKLIRGVDAKVQEVIDAYAEDVGNTPVPEPAPVPAAPAATTTPKVDDESQSPCDQARVLTVGGAILQLLPELEAMVLNGDASCHQALRKLVGDERYVHFSNMINALTGPRPMERFLTEHNRRNGS